MKLIQLYVDITEKRSGTSLNFIEPTDSYKISYTLFKIINLYMCEASVIGTVLERVVAADLCYLSVKYGRIF